MADPKKPIEKDSFTGIETTGHDWDGIKELNLPAPHWWLMVFLVCCIWSVGYWFIYPAWPTLSGNTKGSLGWTEYKKLKEEQAEITSLRGEFAEKIDKSTLADIQDNKQLYEYAIAGGKTIFKENCAACHGTGAQGGKGYPNLNDDDWLWGGSVDDIYTTIKYGVRSTHEATRTSQMPAFGKDGILNHEQIDNVADYMLGLNSGKSANPKGEEVFKQNCTACHGDDGKGKREFGAPNLTDAIWLYGGDKASIMQQVTSPRHGVMPTWEARLPDATIRQLTIYVHSLGGGEAAQPAASK
jgi:cytochrome c oxidase cbb3-type subunit 3